MKISYDAYDTEGKLVTGTINASTTAEATDTLRSRSLIPVAVSEVNEGSAPTPKRSVRLSKPNRLKNVTDFCRQLSILVGAGTPVVQALGAVERQQNDPSFKAIVLDIRQRVENGHPLSTALEHHGATFDAISQSLVAAGESSGALPPMLDRLARMTRQRLRIRHAIIGSLAYPCILLFVSMGVLSAMIGFVMPRFAGLFETLGAPLPPSTQFLMDLSNIMRSYWWAIVPAVILSIGIATAWAVRPSGRRRIGILSLHTPLLGPIVQSLLTARVVRLLGTLIESKVALLDALVLCRHSAGNERYRELIEQAESSVTDGDTLTAAFRASPFISPTVVEAMDTGERTGTLGPVLVSIADVLDEDNEVIIRSLSSIVEPLILILLGLVVGFVAISMFMPLLDLTSATQGVGG
jgi:type II secretory pathway component PulF